MKQKRGITQGNFSFFSENIPTGTTDYITNGGEL